MRKLLPVLLAAVLGAAGAPAQDLRRAPTPADRAKILADGWKPSKDALGAALIQIYQPGGPERPGSTGNTAFRSWMLLWKWCDLLSRPEEEEMDRYVAEHLWLSPEGKKYLFTQGRSPGPDFVRPSPEQIQAALADRGAMDTYVKWLLPPDLANAGGQAIAEAVKPGILAEWINDEELSRLLLQNFSPRDYWPGVIRRLQEIRLAYPEKFREYKALAVALALVYDENFPNFWPHDQVTASLVPRKDMPVAERFNYWVTSNESRALLLDLRKLGPGQLKFLVDAPLDQSEFEWARKNVKYPRSDFTRAFSSISYASGRLKAGEFTWKSGPYTLEEIYRRGGICVDQAYYAMIAGKARGVPTLFFTGQGADGGHAWFGYMKTDDRWQLDCGRYENQNYATGEALDPQTWQPISDHELAFLAQSFHDKLEFSSSEDDILLAGVFEAAGQKDRALRAYNSAVDVCPQNVNAWDARAGYLWRSGATLNQLSDHYNAALRQFVSDPDIRTSQQAALAEVARRQGDTKTAEALETRILAQNKRKRSDLSVNVAAQRMDALVETKQYDEALKEFRRQVQSLGPTGGGNFFFDVVEPFVLALKGAGDTAHAREALSLAYKALKPERGSILDGAFSDLERTVNQR